MLSHRYNQINKIARMRVKNNFYIALCVSILAAALFPSLGAKLQETGYLSVICIMLMYLGMGLSTDTGQLVHGLSCWRLILFVQAVLFVLAPIYAFLLYRVLSPFCGKDAAIGILFIGCIPTTLTSCIMLTQKMGGNEIGALYNAMFSQLLGILVTPLLLSWFLATQYTVVTPLGDVIVNLCVKMIVPFTIGQLLRPIRKYLGQIPKTVSFYGIFIILYMNLSFSIARGDFLHQLVNLLYPVVGCFVLCCLLLFSIVLLSKWFKFSYEDRICSIFTGAHKTLGMGIPLASIYFPDNGKIAMKVSLLIIVYYIITMIISVFVAERMKPSRGELSV